MEQKTTTIKLIELSGVIIGFINIFSSFFFFFLSYLAFYLVAEIDTQMNLVLVVKSLIVGLTLIVSGFFQGYLSFHTEHFKIIKIKYLVFANYAILIPILLLLSLWPLTIVNCLIDFIYGLLVGFLIFKERNVLVNDKYYSNYAQ